jgi:hypothetical protein
MRLLPLTFVFLLVASPVLAQSHQFGGAVLDREVVDSWLELWSLDGVHVTQSTRDRLISLVQSNRPTPPIPPGLKPPPLPPLAGPPGVSTNPFERLMAFLETFPTIRIVVQPAPPRDYSVVINGEECPATEQGVYKVPGGWVDVRVERPGKPPCVWKGPLLKGKQEVACQL